MLKNKKRMVSLLAFMIIVEVLLSLLFNILSIKNVIPTSTHAFFYELLFLAIVFCVITGIMMRRLRTRLAKKSTKTAVGKITDPNNRNIRSDMGRSRYYRITLTACGILLALPYIIRTLFGARAFRLIFAITNFANFTGLFANVYLSIVFFGLMLLITVFIAQVGVEKIRAEHREQMKAKVKAEKKARNVTAQENTEAFRASSADDVDVLGAVLQKKHRAKANEELAKRSAELRQEMREGVDVLGAVLQKKHRAKADEELAKRSAELRQENREGVDVLGAMLQKKHRPRADEELAKRSAELRQEKREGVDVLGAVLKKRHKPNADEGVKKDQQS